MTYLWICHPKKRIRHIFRDEFIHFCAGFVKTNGGFICFYGGFIFSLGWFVLLYESAMTYLWIRHNNKWIRHQIYESFTMYHESASIIRRGFIINGPWLLEIVCGFIFLWTESALCRPVVSCVVLLRGVLSCVLLCYLSLACLVLYYFVLCDLVLSCLVLSGRLSPRFLLYVVGSCLVLWFCLALSCGRVCSCVVVSYLVFLGVQSFLLNTYCAHPL